MRRRWARDVAWLLPAGFALVACGEDFAEGPQDGGAGGDATEPIPACAPGNGHQLTDDFEDGDFDPLWTTWGDGVSETGGVLRFDLPATTDSDYGGVGSIDRYDLRGCQVVMELVEAPPNRDVPADFVLAVGNSNNDNVYIAAFQDDMEFGQFVGGLKEEPRPGSFDPARDRWWRLREQDGTVYLETSPDAGSWTPGADLATPDWMNDTHVSLSAGVWEDYAEPGAFAVDNLNRLPR